MSMIKRLVLEPLLEAQGYGSHVGHVPHTDEEIQAAIERHTQTLHLRGMDITKQLNINTKTKKQ